MTKIRVSKLLSFLLCFVMIATTFGQVPMIASAAESDSSQLTIQMDGEDVNEAELTKENNAELTVAGAGDGDVQWQYYAAEYKMWINIYGETADKCVLTYAKVCNMLDDKDQTVIRCTQKDGDKTIKSNEVTVTVGEATDKADSAASTYAVRRSVAKAAASTYGAASQADDTGETPATYNVDTPSTYNVVINYLFENNQIAADPYTANLAAGSNFSTTVTFPTVQGYLPYLDENQQNSIDLNYEAIDKDYAFNVVYKPTNVNYTVIHYQQNINDDKYTESDRETLQGLTNSTVPEVAKDYEGFYALLYEKPAIAADGSTEVEVYYDRYYYLMNFDLDGGYGVEPIYARYGTPIGDVGTPTKAGYTFKGWSLDGTNIVDLPDKMPAENRTYKAVWEVNDTATVTVVFWGENADDEEYSYIKSAQVNVRPGTEFTYSEDGSLICSLEEHQHSASCGYACGLAEHQHSIENGCYDLTCTESSHNHVSDGCTLACKHTHTVDCYRTGNSNIYSLVETTKPTTTLTDKGNGIYTYTTGNKNKTTHYYLNIGDKWYCAANSDSTSISYNCMHSSHTDDCYTCGLTENKHVHSIEAGCYELICDKTEHTHSDACGYNCGTTAHTHTSDCYMSGAGLDSNLWTFVKSDTVTVAADGSSVVNVYYDRTTFTLTFKNNNSTVYTLNEKWGADISEHWPIKGTNGTTYNSGERWKPSGSSTYTQVLVYLAVMPAESFTLTVSSVDYDTYVMHYMVETLDGETGTTYNGKTFKESFKVTANYNFVTKAEDFFDLDGFTQWASNPSFNNNGKIDIDNGGNVYFYYTRNSYDLVFNDGYNDVKTESVKYEAPLSIFSSYVPDVPSAYEPGSVAFAGWYLNPECTGERYDLKTHIMPAKKLLLYAKWVPVQHTVDFYLDKDALDKNQMLEGYNTLTVNHGEKVSTIPAAPENGSYTFVGWFYMENGQEKAFDFANMPINKDLQVYGKWSSNVLKEYTIYYKYIDSDGKEIEIADPTKGGTLAGITKTFEAKGGSELYADYQEGYFPLVKSHSMTMDINATEENDTNVFTFLYVQKDAVPYTVRYLIKNADGTTSPAITNDDGTEYKKTVENNRKAVVTETFKVVQGYMPDAYQKRLVVSAEEGAVNEIVFYYTEDTTHAYYKITHYTQNTDGATWTEYASSQAVGDIGTTYTADPMTISGFTYDSTVAGTVASGELTANGLELKLYYTRNSYPYQVRYLEKDTNTVLADPKSGTGKYGQIISESAIDITNYEAVAPTSQTLNIKIEDSETATRNIITFYYKEKEAKINYMVVGPAGCGTVSPASASETLKVLSGTAQGSTPTANENFRFVGWYTDADCTTPVSAAQVDADNKFKPTKAEGEVWTAATYYAKFDYALTDLTIVKTGIADVDEDQTVIFKITGKTGTHTAGYSMTVTVKKDEHDKWEATIKDLPVGTYTITEDTDWSWRYTPVDSDDKIELSQTISLTVNGNNTVTFNNVKDNDKWLDSNSSVDNKFENLSEKRANN